MPKYRALALESLREPSKPMRTSMDDDKLRELADSIRELGLLQPIGVTPVDNGAFEVVYGHRRLLASRMLNLAKVPCWVGARDELDEAAMYHENVMREQLSPADEAMRLHDLFEKHGDTEKVADIVKRPREHVERRLNLLMAGYRSVFDALLGELIPVGVAEELNKFDREEDAEYHLHYAMRSGATVRQMRDWRTTQNAIRQRERENPPPQPEDGASEVETRTPASDVPAYTHHAAPWQFGSGADMRPCLFCGSQHEEWKMFRLYTCGPCADKHEPPAYGGGRN